MLETAGSSPEFVRLQAPGSFGAPAYLASEDGSEGATVAKVAKENCRGAPIRPAGVDMDAGIICLRISGLPDHGEVAGEVEVGTGTALTLTVKRRAEFFWGLPAGVLGAGLLLGLLVTLVPAWLAAGIRRLRLEWLLWVNDNHSVAEQIAGARAWADDRIVDGKSAEEVRDALTPVIGNGPAKARSLRSELGKELDKAKLGADHPFARKAREEAARSDHHVSHFIDASGEQATHPAADMIASARLLKALDDRLDKLESERPDPGRPNELLVARRSWQTASEKEAINHVVDLVTKAEDAMPTARSTTREVGEPVDSTLGNVTLIALIGGALVLTALFIAVAIAIAAVTVYVAVYDAKPTFGSWQDYFALAIAAIGSSAAGAVLGLLAPWGAGAPAKE